MISPTNIVIIRPGASSLASFKYNVKKCSGLKSTLELNGFEVEFRPDTELAPTAIAIYKVDEIKSRSTGEVKEGGGSGLPFIALPPRFHCLPTSLAGVPPARRRNQRDGMYSCR